MSRLFFFSVFAALPFLSGCASSSYSVVRGYEGPELKDEKVATLSWHPIIGVRSIRVVGPADAEASWKSIASWDPPTCCKIVKLQPGSYAVDLAAYQHITPMLGGGAARHSGSLIFIARPGHEYYLDRQYAGVGQARYYIEDLSACGEVVAGVKKDTMLASLSRIDEGCGPPKAFEKDPLETFAEIGRPEAQFKIAMRATQVPDQRRKWLCLAAKQGYAKASAQLGMIHLLGLDGARQDLVQAYRWYAVAEAEGHTKAAAALERLETIMTDEQIDEARRLSDWEEAGTCDH